MTPEFDCARAAAVLDATLDLGRNERALLAEMLRCAEWFEGYLFVGFYDLKDDAQITTTQAWRKLSAIGLVDWTGDGDSFLIDHRLLMPQPATKEPAP